MVRVRPWECASSVRRGGSPPFHVFPLSRMRVTSLRHCLCAAVAVVTSLSAEVIQLRPVADASLFESSPENNLGATTALPAGTVNRGPRSRLLLRFDLGGIPVNAIVEAVELRLNVLNAGGVDSRFGLHRLRVAWAEGTQVGNGGAPAKNGEVTWNSRGVDGALWSVPGASAPTDFDAAVSGSTVLAGLGAYSISSTPGLVADVTSWVRSPASNFGWILISDREDTVQTARRIASREDVENGPTLEVRFSMPATPGPGPRFTRLERQGAGWVMVSETTLAGVHELQYNPAAAVGGWIALTNLGSVKAGVELRTTDPTAEDRRFYRWVVTP